MLRQRLSNGSLKEQNLRESIYDDDLQDVVDPPMLQQAYRLPPPPSNTGPCICLAFSVLAVVFLSSIASMLDANSIYIRLRTGENSKRDLAKAVRYAAGMYVLSGLCSVGLIFLKRCLHIHPHLPPRLRGQGQEQEQGQGQGHAVEYDGDEGAALLVVKE